MEGVSGVAGLSSTLEAPFLSTSFVLSSMATNLTALSLTYFPSALPSSLTLCSPVQSGSISILVPALSGYSFTLITLPSAGMSSAAVQQYTQSGSFSYAGLPTTTLQPTFLTSITGGQSMQYTLPVPLQTLLSALPSAVNRATTSFAVMTQQMTSGAQIFTSGFLVSTTADGPVVDVLSPSSSGLSQLCAAGNKLTVSSLLLPSLQTGANWSNPQTMSLDLIDTNLHSVASLGQMTSAGSVAVTQAIDLSAVIGLLSPGRSYAVRVTWGCNAQYYGLSSFMPFSSQVLTLSSPSQHSQLSPGNPVLILFATSSGCQVNPLTQTINVGVYDATVNPTGTTSLTLLTPTSGVLAFDDATTGHYIVDTTAGGIAYTAGHQFVFSVWIGNDSQLAAVAPPVTMLQAIAGSVPTTLELLTPTSPWCPTAGSTTVFTWMTAGSIPVVSVRLQLLVYNNAVANATLPIATSIAASLGSYSWQVPDVTTLSPPLLSCAQSSVQYVAFISSVTDPGVFDSSVLNNRTTPKIPPTPPSSQLSSSGGGGGGSSDGGSSLSAGAIAGAVIGALFGALILCLVVAGLLMWQRDRKQATASTANAHMSSVYSGESTEGPPSLVGGAEAVELERIPQRVNMEDPYAHSEVPPLPPRPQHTSPPPMLPNRPNRTSAVYRDNAQ